MRESLGYQSGFSDRSHRFYREIKLLDEARPLFEKITRGGYLARAGLQKPLNFGPDFDEYVRFLRDRTVAERGEFGAFILSGVEEDNWGRLYVRTKLKRGGFGAVEAVVPTRSILETLGATIRGSIHTHRTDPPYFHFQDPWTVAYESARITKKLHGGRLFYQLIATPNQAGILFATMEGRGYIDSHRPIQYERHRAEIRSEVRKVAREMDWEEGVSEQATGLTNLVGRLLQTKWWVEIGMAILMARSIDSEEVWYEPLDTRGGTLEFLQRLSDKGLVSPFFREYSGFE